MGIVLLDPLAVGAAGHVRDPLGIVQVPGNGLAEPGIEGLGGRPTELNGDLREIHRVAPVVSRTVLHEGNQGGMPDLAVGARLIEQRADRVYDLEVGFLVVTPYVVTFAD